MKSKKVQDLNYVFIRDKHNHEFIRKFIFSSVVFNFLMIAIQIVVFFLFIIRLNDYMNLYFGGSILITSLFLIYIANSKGGNEFKIAWLVPVVVFPLFGVSSYIMFHANIGALTVGKTLKKIKKQTEDLIQQPQIADEGEYLKGLSHYLAQNGKYYTYDNCKFEYFSCGEDFFPVLLNSIKNAKSFIFLEYFIIDVDETWALLLDVLTQKASEGVEVRILYDGLGSLVASTKAYQRYLKTVGVKSHVFMKLIPMFSTKLNNRDHRKIVVIDGKVGFTGGLNISNEYMNLGKNRFNYWKDNAIKIEGKAVQSLTTMFLQTWNLNAENNSDTPETLNHFINFPDNLPSQSQNGFIIPYGDDAFNNEDVAEQVYIYVISHSVRYLHITTPYLIIDHRLQEAMIFAAKRGVDVSLIVPSVPDHLITFCIGRTYIKTMIENGIKVYQYNNGFIHSKTFISDNRVATVGSINLDYRSLYHHFECGTVLYDCDVIKEIEDDFQNTLKDCSEMTMEEYKKIPSRYRFAGRVLRIWSPLL